MQTDADAPKKNRIIPRDVSSYFVDGAIGAAQSAGAHHITLGQFVLDMEEGATVPALQPVVNITMSPEGVRTLIKFLQEMPGISENVG